MDEQTKTVLVNKYKLHMGQKTGDATPAPQQDEPIGKDSAKEALKLKYRALLGTEENNA